MQQIINSGISVTAAADCILPDWLVSHLTFPTWKIRPLQCGLSSKFFQPLVTFYCRASILQSYPDAASEVLEKKRGCFFDGFTVANRASDDDDARGSKCMDASLMRTNGHGHSVRLLDLLDNGHLRSITHGHRRREWREIKHEHQRLQLLQTATETATHPPPHEPGSAGSSWIFSSTIHNRTSGKVAQYIQRQK